MTRWFRVYVVNQIERFRQSKCACPTAVVLALFLLMSIAALAQGSRFSGAHPTVQVDHYNAFIHTSADDVVDKAPTCVFSKDRDFQSSPKTPQAKQLFLHCMCVRGGQWRIGGARKEVCSRGGVQTFYAGIDGVSLHSISRRSKNGASHRKNCDTPPLIGNCPDTSVSRQIPMKTHDLEINRYLERYRPWQLTEVPVWLTLT